MKTTNYLIRNDLNHIYCHLFTYFWTLKMITSDTFSSFDAIFVLSWIRKKILNLNLNHPQCWQQRYKLLFSTYSINTHNQYYTVWPQDHILGGGAQCPKHTSTHRLYKHYTTFTFFAQQQQQRRHDSLWIDTSCWPDGVDVCACVWVFNDNSSYYWIPTLFNCLERNVNKIKLLLIYQ